MQHIGYKFAKDKGIIGAIIYEWMKGVQHLNIHSKGKIIKDWREEKCLLNIGSKNPKVILDSLAYNDWCKQQINTKFHREAYQKAYLKGYFKV